MRRLTVRVPRGTGEEVRRIAQHHGALDLVVAHGHSGDKELDVVTFSIGNAHLGDVIAEVQCIRDSHMTFDPQGVISLSPPASEAARQVLDVQPRSALEIYLSGLQSVGSWTAFLAYAAAAGVVVWIGLFTERSYLLVAAMLIAPFAGPAMNAALATARGDWLLFRRSLLRYVTSIALAITIAWLLSLLLRHEIATGLMVSESLISSVAILLPLVAGAAGALNLSQSNRNSLVSGAATGMLIAASLAPPAGILGMALAIGEFEMVKSTGFLLLLQIAGINLAGALVFRIYGISPQGVRLERGKKGFPLVLGGASLAVLAALFAWQLSNSPSLQRSSIAQHAAQDARQMIDRTNLGAVVKLDAQFTRANVPGQDTLLVTAYVQSSSSDPVELERQLEEMVKQRLKATYNVVPVADVTIVAP